MRVSAQVIFFHWCGFDLNPHVKPAWLIIISLMVDKMVMIMVVVMVLEVSVGIVGMVVVVM